MMNRVLLPMCTSEKKLCVCVLHFGAHEDLHVMVNVGQINMTKIIIMKI